MPIYTCPNLRTTGYKYFAQGIFILLKYNNFLSPKAKILKKRETFKTESKYNVVNCLTLNIIWLYFAREQTFSVGLKKFLNFKEIKKTELKFFLKLNPKM